MFKKVAILLAIALVIHASSKSEVEKLYEEMLEYVGKAIVSGNATLNEALNDLKNAATQVEAAGKNSINSTLQSFQKQLDDLNAKAKQAGKNIDSCRKYEVQFTQLPDTLMDELLACVNNQISTAQQYITDALNRAYAIQQDLATIKQDINNCGSGLKEIKCLAKLAEKIKNDMVDGPKKISDDVSNTAITIENLKKNITECSTNEIAKTPGQAKDIVANFAICVAL